MFNDLSKRVKAIEPSPTLAVSKLASQLVVQGRGAIGLAGDESDFDAAASIQGGDRSYRRAIDPIELARGHKGEI